MNIRIIRLIKPLYLWLVDSPERIETCRTSLGENERQLLYFLLGILFLMKFMHCYVDLIFRISVFSMCL